MRVLIARSREIEQREAALLDSPCAAPLSARACCSRSRATYRRRETRTMVCRYFIAIVSLRARLQLPRSSSLSRAATAVWQAMRATRRCESFQQKTCRLRRHCCARVHRAPRAVRPQAKFLSTPETFAPSQRSMTRENCACDPPLRRVCRRFAYRSGACMRCLRTRAKSRRELWRRQNALENSSGLA